MQGNKSKGGYVALFSLSLVFLPLFLCRDLLLRFLVRKRHSYSNSWQEKRSSASCGLCNEWHLCHVGVVSWKPQLLFFLPFVIVAHAGPVGQSAPKLAESSALLLGSGLADGGLGLRLFFFLTLFLLFLFLVTVCD